MTSQSSSTLPDLNEEHLQQHFTSVCVYTSFFYPYFYFDFLENHTVFCLKEDSFK